MTASGTTSSNTPTIFYTDIHLQTSKDLEKKEGWTPIPDGEEPILPNTPASLSPYDALERLISDPPVPPIIVPIEETETKNAYVRHLTPFDTIVEALNRMHDILESAQLPYVVLGETAKQMKENAPLTVSKIYLGVLPQYNIPELTRLLPTIEPKLEHLTDGFRLTYRGFPIIVRFLTKKYPTLIDPNKIWYAYDQWPIPNPWNLYWQAEDHYDV